MEQNLKLVDEIFFRAYTLINVFLGLTNKFDYEFISIEPEALKKPFIDVITKRKAYDIAIAISCNSIDTTESFSFQVIDSATIRIDTCSLELNQSQRMLLLYVLSAKFLWINYSFSPNSLLVGQNIAFSVSTNRPTEGEIIWEICQDPSFTIPALVVTSPYTCSIAGNYWLRCKFVYNDYFTPTEYGVITDFKVISPFAWLTYEITNYTPLQGSNIIFTAISNIQDGYVKYFMSSAPDMSNLVQVSISNDMNDLGTFYFQAVFFYNNGYTPNELGKVKQVTVIPIP